MYYAYMYVCLVSRPASTSDSIMIDFQATKSLQDSGRAVHIFANPSDPTVCPMLALAVLVFAGDLFNSTPGHGLFGGRSTGETAAVTERFVKSLHAAVDLIDEQVRVALRMDRKSIVPHTMRKSCLSWLASLPDGPSYITSVTNPFNDPCIHPLIHLFIYSFIHACMCLCMYLI
jgi:hypothetical protein